MDEGFGGPVWHASTGNVRLFTEAQLKAEAITQLEGVGSALLGEWHEWTGYCYHLRRRLTPEEQQSVGPVLDIRGTKEASRRCKLISRIMPHLPHELVWREYNEKPQYA